MRFQGTALKLISSCLLVLIAAMGTMATTIHVRPGSKYGPSPSSDPSITYSTCAAGTFACEILGPNNTFLFSTGQGSTLLKLNDLGPVAAGATFNIPSGFTEIFSCNALPSNPVPQSSILVDSGGSQLPAACTALPDALATDFSGFSLNANGSYTNKSNISFSDLVLDAPVNPPCQHL